MLDELTPNARTVLAELGLKRRRQMTWLPQRGLPCRLFWAALMELEFAGGRRG